MSNKHIFSSIARRFYADASATIPSTQLQKPTKTRRLLTFLYNFLPGKTPYGKFSLTAGLYGLVELAVAQDLLIPNHEAFLALASVCSFRILWMMIGNPLQDFLAHEKKVTILKHLDLICNLFCLSITTFQSYLCFCRR